MLMDAEALESALSALARGEVDDAAEVLSQATARDSGRLLVTESLTTWAREAPNGGEHLAVLAGRSPSAALTLAAAVAALDLKDAIDAPRAAALLDPSDLATWRAVGDCAIANGELDLAQAACREALVRSPGDAWATAACDYIEWVRDGDADARARLFARAATEGRDSRATGWIRAFDAYAAGGHPATSLAGLHLYWPDDPLVESASSYLEAPSAKMALTMVARHHGTRARRRSGHPFHQHRIRDGRGAASTRSGPTQQWE